MVLKALSTGRVQMVFPRFPKLLLADRGSTMCAFPYSHRPDSGRRSPEQGIQFTEGSWLMIRLSFKRQSWD